MRYSAPVNLNARTPTTSRRRLSAVLAALMGLAAFVQAPAARAGVVVDSNDLVEFEYQQTGASEEEAVRLACIRAVQATVGRVLHSEYALQGRDLLDPYIQKNWARFTASHYVLERRIERDGFGARIRVQTWPRAVERDLRDKKFLYLPKAVPTAIVMLSESMDGVAGTGDLARRRVVADIGAFGGTVAQQNGAPVGAAVDPTSDPAAFQLARQAASRAGAEILVAGRAETTKVEQRQIYYDTIHTYQTMVHLSVVRVDDGAALATVDVIERASDKDEAKASAASVATAVQAAVGDAMATSKDRLALSAGDNTRFSVLFTDVTANETELLIRHLESKLGAGTRANVRTFYGNTAVVNVDTERAYAALERAVLDYRGFDLRIEDHRGRRVVVSVKH